MAEAEEASKAALVANNGSDDAETETETETGSGTASAVSQAVMLQRSVKLKVSGYQGQKHSPEISGR